MPLRDHARARDKEKAGHGNSTATITASLPLPPKFWDPFCYSVYATQPFGRFCAVRPLDRPIGPHGLIPRSARTACKQGHRNSQPALDVTGCTSNKACHVARLLFVTSPLILSGRAGASDESEPRRPRCCLPPFGLFARAPST